jgi:hypothetical protein
MTTDEPQYRLHAFVCGTSCVKHYDMMGTVPFSWVWQHRPDNCRYAVAGHYDSQVREDRVIVWDLHTVVTKPPLFEPIEPDPVATHTTVDAAIMATAMLYNDVAEES